MGGREGGKEGRTDARGERAPLTRRLPGVTQPHVPACPPARSAEPLRPAPTCWLPSAAALPPAAAGTAHDIPPAAEPPRGAALGAAGLPRPAGGGRGGEGRAGRGGAGQGTHRPGAPRHLAPPGPGAELPPRRGSSAGPLLRPHGRHMAPARPQPRRARGASSPGTGQTPPSHTASPPRRPPRVCAPRAGKGARPPAPRGWLSPRAPGESPHPRDAALPGRSCLKIPRRRLGPALLRAALLVLSPAEITAPQFLVSPDFLPAGGGRGGRLHPGASPALPRRPPARRWGPAHPQPLLPAALLRHRLSQAA